MDFFNAKALAAAQARCTALERELTQKGNDLSIMKQALRSMDDRVFRISQLSDFTQMRPHIAEMVRMMEARRQTESDRISSIINSELFS